MNLARSHIGDDNAALLAAALERNASLRALDLDTCAITDVGARPLFQALSTNRSLTNLDIRSNSIGSTLDAASSAIAALTAALSTNRTLRMLNLTHNPVDDVTGLAAAIEGSALVRVLVSASPRFAPGSMALLRRAVASNSRRRET
eukprot:c33224_g1_i1.p3 GENE.c33224_g1_i1~~c33224_g1_i1.p3  ORF type:complete len:146 (+),score=21.42 c33224_g1_i1:297-734(+)